MSPPLVAALVAAVVLAAIVLVVRSRRSDGVDSFRRQIDALSPEARRTVLDQVHHAAERREQTDDPEQTDGDDAEGGDGPRGT